MATTGSIPVHPQLQTLLSSLPENRFELELEFIQALSSPAYIHFLATSRTLDDSLSSSSSIPATHQQPQSTLQQLQPFLHYLYNTYSQPEYARFLRYPHALFFLESLLVYDEDQYSRKGSLPVDVSGTTRSTLKATSSNTKSSDATKNIGNTKKLWVEWTVPSFRNFCHQQQFLAWQHRHATCYGVGTIATMNPISATTRTSPDDTSHLQDIPATGTVDENDDMDDEDDQ